MNSLRKILSLLGTELANAGNAVDVTIEGVEMLHIGESGDQFGKR